MTADAEGALLRQMGRSIPDAPGYRAAEGRARTESLIREHVAGGLQKLREKLAGLKASAEEEGEEDMLDDLDRIDERMARTIETLNAADYTGVPFFSQPEVTDHQLARVCTYDKALLEDLDLLTTDIMGIRYETIGNLTLREAEGTLAAIELKITNRKDAFETAGDE